MCFILYRLSKHKAIEWKPKSWTRATTLHQLSLSVSWLAILTPFDAIAYFINMITSSGMQYIPISHYGMLHLNLSDTSANVLRNKTPQLLWPVFIYRHSYKVNEFNNWHISGVILLYSIIGHYFKLDNSILSSIASCFNSACAFMNVHSRNSSLSVDRQSLLTFNGNSIASISPPYLI